MIGEGEEEKHDGVFDSSMVFLSIIQTASFSLLSPFVAVEIRFAAVFSVSQPVVRWGRRLPWWPCRHQRLDTYP